MKFKIYSIVFTLTIFVLVQMTILEIPNIFENVLAQQQLEDSQQVSSSDRDRTSVEIEEEEKEDRDRTSVEIEEEEKEDRDRTSVEEEEEKEVHSSADRIPNDGALRR
jgi:hypothetical protein